MRMMTTMIATTMMIMIIVMGMVMVVMMMAMTMTYDDDYDDAPRYSDSKFSRGIELPGRPTTPSAARDGPRAVGLRQVTPDAWGKFLATRIMGGQRPRPMVPTDGGPTASTVGGPLRPTGGNDPAPRAPPSGWAH